jgi:hypothetical protein
VVGPGSRTPGGGHRGRLGPTPDLTVDDLTCLLESMLRQAHTWALVDPLAIGVVGPLLDRHPERGRRRPRPVGRRRRLLDPSRRRCWPTWQRFVPVGGDWDRFCRHADAMLDEGEFFIRKAIGWVLRDTARERPDLVYQWILPRAERASGVTLREAVKRLSPAQAAAVMDRYRNSRRGGS